MQAMDELTYEDVGHLLKAKAEKLIEEEGDPEVAIREAMETIGRSPNVRSRKKKVGVDGRLSFGRDLSGSYGYGIFHPDQDSQTNGEAGEN